jgi:hypothetical protein
MSRTCVITEKEIGAIIDTFKGKDLYIRKYANRKMYLSSEVNDLDMRLCGYVTISDILALKSGGVDIKVVCFKTKRDITEDFLLDLEIHRLQVKRHGIKRVGIKPADYKPTCRVAAWREDYRHE